MPLAVRPFHQGGELVIVDALEGDGIDLDREAGALRRLDALQNLVEFAPAGDRPELVCVEGIERDVDALDAMRREFGGVLFELGAVGGHGQFVERAAREMARQRADQRHDPAPHQRFAAGQAQLAHALWR